MSLLTASQLGKSFGPDEIFSDISVEVPRRSRIALVGPNGAGKTTLLNILIGSDTPTEGTITRARGLRIGYLTQRPELLGAHTLWDEAIGAFAHLQALERELSQLEVAMTDPAQHDAALAAYGDVQERYEQGGGYTYEQTTRTVLRGVGFAPDDFSRPLAQLSGGQKTRALLARLLLEAPDLLALDEPTNHLDIQSIEWLEGYLRDFPGAVLVVSHDRYFMDAVAATVWELDFGTLELYRGNYSHYLDQREERHTRRLKEFEAQQEWIAKEEDYIRRNIAGQNTKQAKGRRTRLERLKKEGGLAAAPRRRSTMTLRISDAGRSGDKVLMTKGLAVGYSDAPAPLFTAPDITLMRGEVAALIGANGAGKSTFLKTVLGQLAPLAGETRIGASVEIGYFAQAHELLNEQNSILDEIMTVKEMTPAQARSFLAQFLFREDDVFRPIHTLSGGERGRVALAKLALAGANFLLLDEPTNHLDIASQEILQTVLADFPGTILLVSHDRYLIDALATQIWSVTPGAMTVFKGTYAEYVAARDAAASASAPAPAERAASNGRAADSNGGSSSSKTAAAKKGGLNPYQRQKRLEALEGEIMALETRLAQLTDDLATASASGRADRVQQLGADYTRTEADLTAAMEQWAALAD